MKFHLFIGNARIVHNLIENGANINAKYSDSGDSALSEVAAKGDISMMKLLIDAGANINAVNKNNQSALIRAIVGGKSFFFQSCGKFLKQTKACETVHCISHV